MPMNCLNCKAAVEPGLDFCPYCGFDLRVQRKCMSLSNMYYNLGLDKAQIRDLSGAIDMLRRSLKFNKLNIQARNLLGLVYFETGEAVSALSEWIISKNIMPENNVASEYIAKLQAEPAKLDMINQTIKKYNAALKCCRENNEDVAAIQLKKILSQNPKLIKGYHLLALIYIRREEYERARKILKKAARIDKTNSTTLRFLKEVDFQTGTQTSLEPRRFSRRGKAEAEEEKITTDLLAANDVVIQPPTFRESSYMATVLNIAIGLLLGGLVVWFLIGPGREQEINRAADEKIIEYSATMASQEAQINELQSQVDSLNETTASAQQQLDQAGQKSTSYENLLKAVEAYQKGNTSQVSNVLMEVNVDQLSVDAKAVYDEIYSSIQDAMFSELKQEGQEAFDEAEYTTAVDRLTKAREINGEDYVVLNRLAHAYRMLGQTDNAIATFQEIINVFPGTDYASRAANSIEQLGGTPQEPQNTTGNDDGDGQDGTGDGDGDNAGDGDTGDGTGDGDGDNAGDGDTGDGTGDGDGDTGDGTGE